MYEVFVDSAANIPAVDVKKYGINVVSFVNIVNGKSMVNFNPDLSLEEERKLGKEFYDAIRAGAEIKTSLVNTGDFVDAFEPVLKEGKDIIYFSLSKNISGTYNAALIASEDLAETYPERKVLLVDSLNASLAQGIMAIYATMMRDKGVSVEEAARVLNDAVIKMNGVFTVGDLKYLAKTGRISSATALAGNVLNVKPILRGNKEGYIVQFRKCRGRKKSLDTLADLVCDKIKERVQVKDVINTSYDYCTGTHVGPDTIALFFIANDRELEGRPSQSDYVEPEVLKMI